jgi:hypothetical protein
MRLSSGLSRSMLSVGSAMFLGDVTCQQIEQHSSSATSPPTAEATTGMLFDLLTSHQGGPKR